MTYIIIGGVAAGAGAAARLRRLDENARIILLEKGAFISYANCGLPYHLGGVIPERENLLVMPPEKFAAWFDVEVRTRSEAVKIDRKNRLVTVRSGDKEYTEKYDKLLIATGATPVSEADGKRVFHLWTLADMDKVSSGLRGAKSAVIVGAGFIGLELAENLRERGLGVTVIQRSAHVLPTLDGEMAGPLAAELERLGVKIRFGCTVKAHNELPDGVEVELDCGEMLKADAAVVSTGVRPNSGLARDCGIECGTRGHILVDARLRTSDPHIYAAGDVAELREPLPGAMGAVPLAGPANKQGRIAAGNMAGGNAVYKGSFGVSVVKVGRLTAASVGPTEARLRERGTAYKKLYIHPNSNASYFPGGSRMTLKLLFAPEGTILGAQIVGGKGVDKRIDTIAQAMRNGLKAPELGELELAYAPPYSSAKDPVNFAGFVAENILSGLTDPVYPDALPADAVILDVREGEENALGALPGAVNIPLGELRKRCDELDKSKLVVCYCQVGLRGYLAERILKQKGFRAANLSGGFLGWKLFHPVKKAPGASAAVPESPAKSAGSPAETLDVRTLPCPGPVMKLKARMAALPEGGRLRLLAAPGFEPDLRSWAGNNGFLLQGVVQKESHLEAEVVKASPGASAAPAEKPFRHRASLVLFSNDFDKAMAALILANGLAASGAEVSIFFTFWGLSVLRKDPAPAVKKNFISRMFGFMLPKGAAHLALSKMNMMGMGSAMMKSVMKSKSVLTLPELIRSAREAGVKFIACDMAMDVMGITREELIEVDEVAGSATFAKLASRSNNTLFI